MPLLRAELQDRYDEVERKLVVDDEASSYVKATVCVGPTLVDRSGYERHREAYM